jgi:hypothetical protein
VKGQFELERVTFAGAGVSQLELGARLGRAGEDKRDLFISGQSRKGGWSCGSK